MSCGRGFDGAGLIARSSKIAALREYLHKLASMEPFVEFGGERYSDEDSIREDYGWGFLTEEQRDELLNELALQRELNRDAVTVITSVLNLLEAPR